VLALRLLLALTWASCIVWDVLVWVEEYDAKYWFTQLTHWGAVMEMLYFALLSLTTALALYGKRTTGGCNIPFHVQATWFLGSVLPSSTSLIALFYWWLVFEGGKASALTVTMHGLNYFLVAVDLVCSAQPFLVEHFWLPMSTGAVYAAFTYLYFVLGGTYQDGHSEYIYKKVNWANPKPTTRLIIFSVFVAAPGLHFVNWLLRRLAAAGGSQHPPRQAGGLATMPLQLPRQQPRFSEPMAVHSTPEPGTES